MYSAPRYETRLSLEKKRFSRNAISTGAKIDNEGARMIAQALTVNTTLNTIYLGSATNKNNTRNLFLDLNTKCTDIIFSSTGNAIGTEGIKALSEALERNTTLTYLEFSSLFTQQEKWSNKQTLCLELTWKR